LEDKNREIFLVKEKSGKCSTETDKFFGNRVEIWNSGEMHHCLRRDGRPWTVRWSTSKVTRPCSQDVI